MNYYEKHIGDYIRDTVSLTMLEDGAYNRLIDQVYQTERPLPLDRKMIYRLARATAPSERKAVDFVIATFFRQTDDGYVQKRIAIEIDRYQEKQRKAKASADARWNRTKTDANASQTHDAPDMRTHCDGNAHQAPSTKHQTPDPNHKDSGDSASNPSPEARAPLPVGALCIAMRAAGIEVQPADPRMIALADQGVEAETVTAACAEAKRAKPGERIKPGYVVAIIKRWAEEAAALNVTGAAAPKSKPNSIADQLNARMNRGTDPAIIDIN